MINKRNLTIITFVAAIILLLPYCTTVEEKGKEKPKPKEVVLEEMTISYPDSVDQSCLVSMANFDNWFVDGRNSANGVVKSANSLGSFDNSCDFYKWSWQMFLWHFSPKDDSYVYDSAPFYDLEGEDLVIDGQQTIVRGGKLSREGQAGTVSGVLMSQKAGITPDGSIVYYAIHVNDVYAYMRSGQKTGHLNLNTFPTTQDQLNSIKDYAETNYGVTIEDGESLAMELKSSWIELPSEADASRYITIVADVPSYTKTSNQQWTWDGTTYDTGVTLAMVGYHVVGSAAGHPEMIWSTFEHVDNNPSVDYYYVNNDKETKKHNTLGADGTPKRKNWTFADGNTKTNASNAMFMQLNGNDINAQPGDSISPSSTMRLNPWGNKPDASSAANNTEIISLNINMADLLMDGDIRKNYFLVGSTWTTNGVPHVGNQLPVVRGSEILANSTMETYFQYDNCFDCHKSTNGSSISGLSHIFDNINALPDSLSATN